MDSVSDQSSSPLSDRGSGSSSGRATVTLRFLISSKEAGSIIGKKGDNIKKIREESGARINISDASCVERIVSVMGSMTQILKAFSMISTKFEEDQPSGGQNGSGSVTAGQVTFRLIVPNANCGSLIGKGGSNIKELRESTGAIIQVANEMLPNSNERVVSLSGSTDSICPCIKRLFEIATETKPKGPVLPYQPGGNMMVQPGMYGGRQSYGMHPMNMMPPRRPMGIKGGRSMPFADMTSYYSAQQNLMASNYSALMRGGFQEPGARGPGYRGGRPQTKELEVPNEMIGTIIGRHGLKINEIRQVSRATIKISDAEEGSPTRRVTIIGPPDCVDSAVYLINAIQTKYSKI